MSFKKIKETNQILNILQGDILFESEWPDYKGSFNTGSGYDIPTTWWDFSIAHSWKDYKRLKFILKFHYDGQLGLEMDDGMQWNNTYYNRDVMYEELEALMKDYDANGSSLITANLCIRMMADDSRYDGDYVQIDKVINNTTFQITANKGGIMKIIGYKY